VPAEMLTKDGRMVTVPIPTTPAPEDETLRRWARQHVERVHRLKLHIAAFVLGMIVLTPVWALVEWQSNGAFERWSANGNPGDWEPWILYVGLVWGLVVAIVALRTYFDRPTTEAEIERTIERQRERR
jgi:hypothetical protein